MYSFPGSQGCYIGSGCSSGCSQDRKGPIHGGLRQTHAHTCFTHVDRYACPTMCIDMCILSAKPMRVCIQMNCNKHGGPSGCGGRGGARGMGQQGEGIAPEPRPAQSVVFINTTEGRGAARRHNPRSRPHPTGKGGVATRQGGQRCGPPACARTRPGSVHVPHTMCLCTQYRVHIAGYRASNWV